MTASWATEKVGTLAKVRNFSVTLNGPLFGKILLHWYLWMNLNIVNTMPTSLWRVKNLVFLGIPLRLRAKFLALFSLGPESKKLIRVAGSVQHSL